MTFFLGLPSSPCSTTSDMSCASHTPQQQPERLIRDPSELRKKRLPTCKMRSDPNQTPEQPARLAISDAAAGKTAARQTQPNGELTRNSTSASVRSFSCRCSFSRMCFCTVLRTNSSAWPRNSSRKPSTARASRQSRHTRGERERHEEGRSSERQIRHERPQNACRANRGESTRTERNERDRNGNVRGRRDLALVVAAQRHGGCKRAQEAKTKQKRMRGAACADKPTLEVGERTRMNAAE